MRLERTTEKTNCIYIRECKHFARYRRENKEEIIFEIVTNAGKFFEYENFGHRTEYMRRHTGKVVG